MLLRSHRLEMHRAGWAGCFLQIYTFPCWNLTLRRRCAHSPQEVHQCILTEHFLFGSRTLHLSLCLASSAAFFERLCWGSLSPRFPLLPSCCLRVLTSLCLCCFFKRCSYQAVNSNLVLLVQSCPFRIDATPSLPAQTTEMLMVWVR